MRPRDKEKVYIKHTLHNVITVSDETERNRETQNAELPLGDGGLGLEGVAGGPGGVDDGPGADGVADVVGAVGEGGGAGREHLDERVQVLDLVGVLGRVRVDALHAPAVGRAVDAVLRRVDVVVEPVQERRRGQGRGAREQRPHVLGLVQLARAHRVVAQRPHRPADGAPSLAERGPVPRVAFG